MKENQKPIHMGIICLSCKERFRDDGTIMVTACPNCGEDNWGRFIGAKFVIRDLECIVEESAYFKGWRNARGIVEVHKIHELGQFPKFTFTAPTREDLEDMLVRFFNTGTAEELHELKTRITNYPDEREETENK